MDLDLMDDYLVWDNTEAVTLVSARTAGDVEQEVATALRLPLTTKEIAASNGVYTGQDVVWLLPTPLLGGVTPKPRDRVQDENDIDWTVLENSYSALDGTHRLTCRDLVIHNDLRDLITIKRASISQDDAAANVRTWSTTAYADVPAKVQPIVADIVEERGMSGFRVRYEIPVGQALTVTDEDRIEWNSRILQITGWRDPERIDSLMVILAEEVP